MQHKLRIALFGVIATLLVLTVAIVTAQTQSDAIDPNAIQITITEAADGTLNFDLSVADAVPTIGPDGQTTFTITGPDGDLITFDFVVDADGDITADFNGLLSDIVLTLPDGDSLEIDGDSAIDTDGDGIADPAGVSLAIVGGEAGEDLAVSIDTDANVSYSDADTGLGVELGVEDVAEGDIDGVSGSLNLIKNADGTPAEITVDTDTNLEVTVPDSVGSAQAAAYTFVPAAANTRAGGIITVGSGQNTVTATNSTTTVDNSNSIKSSNLTAANGVTTTVASGNRARVINDLSGNTVEIENIGALSGVTSSIEGENFSVQPGTQLDTTTQTVTDIPEEDDDDEPIVIEPTPSGIGGASAP